MCWLKNRQISDDVGVDGQLVATNCHHFKKVTEELQSARRPETYRPRFCTAERTLRWNGVLTALAISRKDHGATHIWRVTALQITLKLP